MLIKSRLKKAEVLYCETLQDLLTNPQNEDLPNEIIEPQIEEAFNKFVQELLLNEDETAAFIAEGNVFNEMEILPPTITKVLEETETRKFSLLL